MEYDSVRISDFAANLRFLCEQSGSITAVCRKIGLNRQQFNKYLAGLHLPSAQNMRLIANFFGLSVPVLLSDPSEFRTLVEGNFFHVMESLRRSPELKKFMETAIIGARTESMDLVGVYDRYQYSSIYKGLILRSAFCIYRNDDFFQHYYIERFPSYDSPNKIDYIFKYHGFCFNVAGRLFTMDFESVQRNEMTFGVFAPVQRSAKKFMFGITSGISATMFRQPFSTKIALHYRRPGLIARDELDKLTVLDPQDPSIPREALQFLGDGHDMIQIS